MGRRLGRRHDTTQVRDILVGTLVIDMADAKKGQLAWRGMGVKEVNTQAKPEKRDKSITDAVKKIFKNYPPKVKTLAAAPSLEASSCNVTLPSPPSCSWRRRSAVHAQTPQA